MKSKIQTLGFLCLFTLFSYATLQAKPITDYPNIRTLRTEIITLIKKPDLSALNKHEEIVKLSFLVNSKKELVVVDAGTKNDYLESYLKQHLNYQPIKTDFVQLNKIYYIKLVFKKRN
ncbi:MAG: hypothetical protein AAGJ18_08760 [Bacteroidota bacterium]